MRKKPSKLAYGIGNLGYSVISQTITNFFMFFGTSVLKLSGALVGVAIAISTLWDGITDPFVGYLSDSREFLKMGNRRGYMLVATIGMTIVNIAIWFVPLNAGELVKFIWITIGLVGIETFNTLYATPYMALGTDISTNYNDRTKIQSIKTVFFLIGMIVPSVLLYLFLPNSDAYPIGQLNPYGYRKISVVTSLICFVSGTICVFFTHQKNRSKLKNNNGFKSMFSNFISAIKIKPLAIIIFGYAFVMLSAVILTSVGMHFFTYCFSLSSKQITILLSTLLIGTLVSQPLWYFASVKKDKKIALLSGIFVSVVGVFSIITIFLLRYELKGSAYWWIMVSIFVSGVGSGALYTLPNSMYSDAITKVNRLTGEDKTATYSGVMTFVSNIMNCILQLCIGITLDIIKFNPDKVVQELSVQTGLAIIIFVGIQFALISGYYIFSKYGKVKYSKITAHSLAKNGNK